MTTAQLRHGTFALAILFDALVFDQLSKYFSPETPIPLLGGVSAFGLRLARTLNPVFAFSLPAPEWMVFAVVGLVVLLVAWRWSQEVLSLSWSAFGLSLVLGGAVGNIVDRLWHGGVVDWIEVRTPFTSTGSFNLADAAIVAGVLLWFILAKHDQSPVVSSTNAPSPQP